MCGAAEEVLRLENSRSGTKWGIVDTLYNATMGLCLVDLAGVVVYNICNI